MEPWLSYPRCYVDSSELIPGEFLLSKQEGRHLNRVRRIGLGSKVTVLNGVGLVGRAVLQEVDRDRVTLDIQEVLKVPPAEPEITLVIAALKQSAWDEVLKHAVELGVNRIIRVQSERSVAEVQADKESKKRQRWQECMIEAIKQSGNPWIPFLNLVSSVEEAVQGFKAETIHLLAGMESDPIPVSQLLKDVNPCSLAIWIGPEGDFTPSEREIILNNGAQLVHLGGRILRAETAALSLLSFLRLRA